MGYTIIIKFFNNKSIKAMATVTKFYAMKAYGGHIGDAP
jgi:hypothetical protein